MEPQEKLTTQQFVIDRLHDLQRKAEAGNFADALEMIREIKAADPKNIYLIAIEKQIAKLGDRSLPEENRSGIVKSLPQMLERAIGDIQRRIPAAPKPDETQQKNQKEAALEKLKSQYFQRADDYVEKHDYQRALEEIRRIYIIEPGSVVAKEYEQKIEQLASLHARSESAAEEVEIPKPVEVIKESLVETEAEPLRKEVILESDDEESQKSKLPLILGAVAAIILLAVGGWFIFGRGSGAPPQVVTEQTQQPSAVQDSAAKAAASPESTAAQQQKSAAAQKPSSKTEKSEKKQPEVKPTPQTQKPPASQAQTQQQPKTQTPAQTTKTPALAATTTPVQQQPAQQPPAQTSTTPAPMPFVAIESPPEIIKRAAPVYPEIAIKMGIQGRVTVEVTIDAQGKPIQTKVVRSSSDVFNDAAVQAVMKYTFKPAMQSTGPVTAKVYIPIDFRLK